MSLSARLSAADPTGNPAYRQPQPPQTARPAEQRRPSVHTHHAQMNAQTAAATGGELRPLRSPAPWSLHPVLDFSSTGCSLEESRSDRYTLDFLRCLTPRSLAACESEGVVVEEELVYKSVEEFTGEATLETTTGEVITVGKNAGTEEGAAPAEDAELAATLQRLRWEDHETARRTALNKARAARRKLILASMPQPPAGSPQGDSRMARGGVGLAQTLPVPRASFSRASVRSLSSTTHHQPAASPSYPLLQEHPFFKQHPQRSQLARLGLETSSASTFSVALPVGSLSAPVTARSHHSNHHCTHHSHFDPLAPSDSEHVCGRMRQRMARQEAREKWEQEEKRKEEREIRKRERKQSQLWQEKMQRRKEQERRLKQQQGRSSSPTRSLYGGSNEQKDATPSADDLTPLSPRSTRAELLRSAGPASLLAAQLAASSLSADSGAAGDKNSKLSSTLRSLSPTKDPAAAKLLAATTQLAGTLKQPLPPSSPHTQSLALSPSLSARLAAAGTGGSFSERQLSSLVSTAEAYTALLASEKRRVVARQQAQLDALAAAEALRLEGQKKQAARAAYREEQRRLQRMRREVESAAAQKAREAKLQRVAMQQAARIARIEEQAAEKAEKQAARRAQMEEEKQAALRDKKEREQQAEYERRTKLEQQQQETEQRLQALMQHLEEAYHTAQAKLEERNRELSELKAEQHRAAAEKRVLAAQRTMDECQSKLDAYLMKLAKHTGENDTDRLLAEAAAKRIEAIRRKRAEKEAIRDERLAELKEQEEARVEAIRAKKEADEQRIKRSELHRARTLLVEAERKRLEEARARANHDRLMRKKQFAQAVRDAKWEEAQRRIASIDTLKALHRTELDRLSRQTHVAVSNFKKQVDTLKSDDKALQQLMAKHRALNRTEEESSEEESGK